MSIRLYRIRVERLTALKEIRSDFALKKLFRRLIEPGTPLERERLLFSDRDISRLIVPLFFEQLLVMIVGIADTFMISYAGDTAVSGVSLVNMFNTIFIYLFTALASGGAVVVSQYIGSGDRDHTKRSAGQLLMSITVLGVFLMAISLIWNRQLLGLLFGSVETAVMEAGVTYLRISACAFPFMAIYNAGAALFRSMGRTKYTMYISVIANIINVIGNAIGIFVLHAGVVGVAYPTLIAHIFSAVAITVLCFNKERTVHYDLKDIFRVDGGMIKRILKVAVPNGVENGLFQLIKVALSSVTALFGTAQIAANGIAQSFWSLAALIGVAMGPAFITVIGRCVGAGDREAARYYMNKMMRITLLSSVLWNALIFAVTPAFMQFYPLSDEVKTLVVWLVLIHNVFNALLFPFSGAMANGLRAAGDVKFAMYVSVISTVAARLILSIVFGIWMNMGVIGIALAMCCDWAVRTVCIIFRYRSGKWLKNRVI